MAWGGDGVVFWGQWNIELHGALKKKKSSFLSWVVFGPWTQVVGPCQMEGHDAKNLIMWTWPPRLCRQLTCVSPSTLTCVLYCDICNGIAIRENCNVKTNRIKQQWACREHLLCVRLVPVTIVLFQERNHRHWEMLSRLPKAFQLGRWSWDFIPSLTPEPALRQWCRIASLWSIYNNFLCRQVYIHNYS